MAACRMIENSIKGDESLHHSVLLSESILGLNIKPNGIYVDATFGRGGHSELILEKLHDGKLIAIDKDPDAIAFAKTNFRFKNDPRFVIKHGSFGELTKIIREENCLGKVDGILLDLGVSSPQLDNADRGFSFMRDGKLDMRMDNSKGIDAAEFIATITEENLTKILWEFGEERFARRIAKSIVIEREKNPIQTTKQLAEIVARSIPGWQKGKHPATRTFQAIRIALNEELNNLNGALEQSQEILAIGGRLVVISFHSLEDRIVKHFMQREELTDDAPRNLPIKFQEKNLNFKRVGRAIKASDKEVTNNPRARSAILRIGEKLL